VTSGERRASIFCLTAASSEKYTKSLTYKHRVSGDDEDESSSEKAWFQHVLVKADACKDGFDLGVPMTRAVAKAVDGALKEPVFVFFGIGVPNGGLNNSYLVAG
jgi:hypothetical protein